MSRIDELIQELCPSGVEYKQLGDAGRVVRGKRFVKDDMIDEGVPCVHYGEIYTKYGISAVQSISYVSHERARTLRFAQPGDVIMASAGETIEDIGKSVAWLGNEPIAIHDACYSFSSSMDPKFVSYFFASRSFRDQIRRSISSSKISSISTQNVAKARIPMPPLEVQREIVRVLDKFTELEVALEAELEAELEARRAQYKHYRDELVGANGRRRIRLADLGTFVRGRRFTKNDVVESGIPSLHYGEIYTAYGTSATQALRNVRAELRDQLRYAQPGSVVFAGVGETVADVGKAVAWLGEEPIATHDDTFTFSSELNPKYVAYAVQTADFHQQKERHVSRAKVKRLSAMGLGAIEIPVPSLEEQESIVRSLDKFDALVGDIVIGLPAELAARRKQYEHYRDRLLTFKELAS
ncbi:type I restriction enzyme, S subunit [Bowdeniella nasicola]|uniref:Type I restriction enzyme, S subunit n=1 Tax=Bowdeniella nasicola TaxID=208480 RepID=A0A1H4A157_9ACTO|nr:restriction endonuclease subunit S [Bowdeniella nasicola]SEA29706.1 type I restriction enzyme, S subunit [Bowdeniella nasicola]